jgi:hypothetical protein
MGHESLMLSLCCVLVMVLYIARDFRRWRAEKREDEKTSARIRFDAICSEENEKHQRECDECRILVKGANMKDANR